MKQRANRRRKENKKVVDMSSIVSPCYYPLATNYVNMMRDKAFNQLVIMASGRSAGKSHVTFDMIVSTLPFFPDDDAIIITYSVRHKVNTCRLLRTKLKGHGYSKYKERTGEDGEKIFQFGRNNSITVMSLKGVSKDDEREKMKTSVNFNYENGGRLRYLVAEEWTAIINIFDTYLEANNAISSFGRLRPKDNKYMSIYIYNPPNDDMHPVNDWNEFVQEQKPMNIHATIFDLKPDYQSQEDLKIINTWESMGNTNAIDHYYRGIVKLRGGKAFTFDYEWKLPSIKGMIFTEYQVFIDNGEKDATTFSLQGITSDKKLVRLYTYYHSGRQSGKCKAFSDYALDLKKFLNRFASLKKPIIPKRIVTDSLTFTTECSKIGIETQFIEKKATENATFRELAYDYTDEMIKQHRYYVYDIEENQIAIEQMLNANKDTRKRFPRVAKVNNETTPEKRQIHCVDCDTYGIYFNSKYLLGREEIFLYAR